MSKCTCSEELKAKMSLLYKGKKRALTSEARAKMSAGRKGKKLSAEHKLALINSNTGRLKSQEEKQKISAAKMGDKNPRWKGGIYEENYLVRTSSPYKRWSKQVKERDAYTCQLCGDMFTRAALSTGGRAGSKFLSLFRSVLDACDSFLFADERVSNTIPPMT